MKFFKVILIIYSLNSVLLMCIHKSTNDTKIELKNPDHDIKDSYNPVMIVFNNKIKTRGILNSKMIKNPENQYKNGIFFNIDYNDRISKKYEDSWIPYMINTYDSEYYIPFSKLKKFSYVIQKKGPILFKSNFTHNNEEMDFEIQFDYNVYIPTIKDEDVPYFVSLLNRNMQGSLDNNDILSNQLDTLCKQYEEELKIKNESSDNLNIKEKELIKLQNKQLDLKKNLDKNYEDQKKINDIIISNNDRLNKFKADINAKKEELDRIKNDISKKEDKLRPIENTDSGAKIVDKLREAYSDASVKLIDEYKIGLTKYVKNADQQIEKKTFTPILLEELNFKIPLESTNKIKKVHRK